MPESNPTCCKVLIQVVSLVEVLPCLWILLDQEVVRPNCIPRYRRVRISTDQLMRYIVKLSLLTQFNQYAAEEGNHINVVRIVVDDPFQDFVASLVVLLVEELLSLDVEDIIRFLLVQ